MLANETCYQDKGEFGCNITAQTVPDAYPGLPAELQEHYQYAADAGRVIKAIPSQFAAEAIENPTGYQVSLPVKYVLERGYTVRNGYVYRDVSYNRRTGAQVPDKYFEH